MQHTQPEWLEHAEREWGFGKVKVQGRRLRFELIHSETGEIADSVDLKIGRSAMRPCNAASAVNLESKPAEGNGIRVSDKEIPTSPAAFPSSELLSRLIDSPELAPNSKGLGRYDRWLPTRVEVQ